MALLMPPKGESKKLVGAAKKERKWSPAHQARLDSVAQMDQVLRDVTTTLAKLSVRTERKSSDSDSFEVLGGAVGIDGLRATLYDGRTGEKRLEDDDESRKSVALARGLVRGIFKPDHPYRTRLGYFGTLVTSGAGVLNESVTVASVSSVTEWTSIDALFDEVFIHSMTLRSMPRNAFTASGSISAGATWGPGVSTTTTNLISNAGIMIVALFNGAAGYSSATGMLANPTHASAQSGSPWTYAWRNNTKFDPRGVVAQNTAWQGWTLIGNVTNYGGSVQIRSYNDVMLGDGTHALTLSDIAVTFDVSFRARA